jgi:hypothetical protein
MRGEIERKQQSPVVMGPRIRGDDSSGCCSAVSHFFTSGHAGSGGPNAWSPGMVARIL